MTVEKINSCVEHAQKFAREYHSCLRFDGYTETEVIKGCAYALALVEGYVDAKNLGQLPLSESFLDQLLEVIGIEDERPLGVTEIAINLLSSNKSSKEGAA